MFRASPWPIGDSNAVGHYCVEGCSVCRWTICEHPERPPDGHACVHMVGCLPCRIGAEANARQWPKQWKLLYDLQTLYWADG